MINHVTKNGFIQFTLGLLFGAILLNVTAWTGVSIKLATEILSPPEPDVSHFDNGARFVTWADGSQEFLPGRKTTVEFLPSDDPRLKQ